MNDETPETTDETTISAQEAFVAGFAVGAIVLYITVRIEKRFRNRNEPLPLDTVVILDAEKSA